MVARPRLAAHAERSLLPALMLVAAPAGFGKTTAVVELTSAQTNVAWVSLDRRENDVATFWAYVIAAIRSVDETIGDGAQSMLAGVMQSSEPLVAQLINDIDATDADITLVLDDYHQIDSPEVHEGLAFLLQHRPPQLHVIVSTRVDPPLPLAALRARGELAEIRAAELRFTDEETTLFLNEAMNLGVSTDDIARLAERTEGWVAALQLAALSLQGRDDPSAFVQSFSGDDRFILDYLVGEVLDLQPPEVRDFLLQTSVLDRMTGSLCDALTQRTDGKAMLESLDRSNLFLVPLDDRRQWYRYHHLFADVLRSHLVDERPGEELQLHQRAANWLEAHDSNDAISHALLSGDVALAARLTELAAPGMRRARQDATLRGWMEAIPPSALRNRPVLTIGKIGALMVTGDAEGVENLLTLVESGMAAPDREVFDFEEYERIAGQLGVYRSGLALLHGDFDQAAAHATAVLELTGPEFDPLRGPASALLGLSLWAQGDLVGAEARYAEAIERLLTVGLLADVLGCSVALGDMQIAQGHLSDAMRTFERGLRIVADNPGLRGAADMHVGAAELFLERYQLDDAERHVLTARDLGPGAGLPQSPYRLRVVEARLQRALGDGDAALALLEEAELLYDTDFSPSVRPVSALRVRMQAEMGDLDAAKRWIASSGITSDDEAAYLREFEQLTFAALLVAQAETGDITACAAAVNMLHRLHSAAASGGREANAIEALALLGLAHDLAGNREAARDAIEQALTLAEPEQQTRTFMKPSLRALIAEITGDGPAARHAAVVRRLAASPAQPQSSQRRTQPVDELSARELDVLRLLKTDLGGPAIARELHVSLNTFRTHTKNIYMKLAVNNRREAIRRASEIGL